VIVDAVVLLNAASVAESWPGRWWVPPPEALAAIEPGRAHVKVLALEGEGDVWAARAVWIDVDERDEQQVTGTVVDSDDMYEEGDRLTAPLDRIFDLVLVGPEGDYLFNERRARFALGKRVLVGITVLSPDEDEVVERHSFAGTVAHVEPGGIELKLDDQTSYWLPPDATALREAAPGEYSLRDTGQTIVDPDYVATWTITHSGFDSFRLPAEGFVAPNPYEELRDELLGRGVVGRAGTKEAIDRAERALGPLPPDYRAFLAEFGWIGVGPLEVTGLGAGIPAYLDVVEVTQSERAEGGLPARLVVLANDGYGNLVCIDTASEAIALWDHETSGDEGAVPLAETFSAWLLHALRALPGP
jgi:SMI1-KNR4 cell-wall